MIDLEDFNSQKFDDIVNAAKKQIGYLTNEWTNFQQSDPGMTLIDLFAWLKMKQHEHMSEVSPQSQLRLLGLLGVNRIRNKGSQTLIKLSDVPDFTVIPKGTKWKSNKMIFENNEEESVVSSNIVSVDFESKLSKTNVSYSSFNGKRIFSLFGEGMGDYRESLFKINFDKPISSGTKLKLYFDVFLENEYERNPVGNEDDFIEMADVVWEFYGSKDGKMGWHELEVLYDETHNFLFSGMIAFNFDGSTEKCDGKFSLRARLISQKYDILPRITNLYTNVFRVSQKSTMCENTIFKKRSLSKNGCISIKTHLSLYGVQMVYANVNKSWKIIKDFSVNRDIEKGEAIFKFDKKVISLFSDFDLDEDVIMVVSFDKSVEDKMILGSGTGISDQKISLKMKNILYDEFDIMVGKLQDKEVLFDKWEKVEDFYSSDKYSKSYVLDCEESKICFGDNEYGRVPRKLENSIVLINFATTFGKNSNIKSNTINSVMSENSVIKKSKIFHITDAVGGADSESFNEMKSRAATVLKEKGKAVTIEDYEAFARKTPGIIKSNVKAFTLDEIGKGGVGKKIVSIVVRVAGNRNIGLDGYKDNIKHFVDKYRLINTKVVVSEPLYIGLDISGQVVVNSYYRESSDFISENIRKFVEKVNDEYGSTFYYGELFGMLDRLKCVSYVDNLSIDPMGDYVEITDSDDIVIPPNGVYYVEKLDINCLNNSESVWN